MADKKSNLTSYDRKFIACVVSTGMSMTILAISLFGLYYHGKYTNFKAYMKMNEKRYAVVKEILKNYDSELRLRGMEWDYTTKGGIGAELVPEEEIKKEK